MFHIIQNWFKSTLSNTQTRLVLILMVAISVIILIVGFTSYHTSKNVLQKELNEPQRQMLQISMNHIDQYLKESNQIAVKLALNSHVYEFFTNDVQNSYENISEIYQKLATLIINTAYINSIYIYDINNDSFVGIPQGFSSNRSNFNDSDWTDVVDDFGDEMMLVKRRELPEGARYRGSNITLFRKVMIHGEFVGVIAINLKQENLFAKLKPVDNFDSNSMRFIIDQKDNVLYATDNHNFNSETIDYALDSVKAENLDDITYKDNILLANQLQSSFTGWNYVSIVSQESVLKKSEKIRNVVFSVSLLALLLGCIAIFYINAVELKPINRIKKLFRMEDNQMLRRDLVHLESLIDDLLSDHTHLSKLTQKVRAEAISKFFYDIYKGNIKTEHELIDKWKTSFEEWKDDSLTIVIVSIDNYDQWKNQFTSHYHSVLKFGLSNILTEVLGTCWRLECTELEKDKMVIVLQDVEEKEDLLNHTKTALTNVDEALGFTVSAGVSTTRQGVTRLKESMEEADRALQYRLYKGYGVVIAHEEVHSLQEQEAPVNDTDIGKLIDVIKAGYTQQAVQRMEHIFHEIKASNWDPIKALTYLGKMGKQLLQLDYKDSVEENRFKNQLRTMHLNEIAKVLTQQVTEKTEQIHELSKSKRYIVCQQMIDYISSNLSEPIGIPEIADSVGISVSLASQWFKEETNETIYSYLTRARMELAEELLRNTNEKVSEIGCKVGYQHENSFIRGFRKFKNMTPGKYREMYIKTKRFEKNVGS